MECVLFKQTITANIYAVNKSFYLVVPKLRVDPNIEVVIDDDIIANLDNYANTSNIRIMRVFAKDYFPKLGTDLVVKHQLKSLINEDINATKQALESLVIPYSSKVVLTTPFKNFKEWYQSDIDRQKIYDKISTSIADPMSAYEETSDELTESQKRVQELLKLKESLLQTRISQEPESASVNTSTSNTKGKRIALNDGRSNYIVDDGFINVVFLSIVTIVVTVGSIIAMLAILR